MSNKGKCTQKKSCLTFKNQMALFLLFDGVISDVAKRRFGIPKTQYLCGFPAFSESFPLNGGDRFRAEIVQHAAHARHFGENAVGNAF